MNLNRDFRSFAAGFGPRELAGAIGILLTVILALVGLAHGLGQPQSSAKKPNPVVLISGTKVEVVSSNVKRPPTPCSLTVAEEFVITAGHCGPKGSRVLVDGREVGMIERNLLEDGEGLDLAFITVRDGVRKESSEVDTRFQVKNDDVMAATAEVGAPRFGWIKDASLVKTEVGVDGEGSEVSVVEMFLDAEPGWSGAPVYNNGKVVGIVQGGDMEESTYITPLSLVFVDK